MIIADNETGLPMIASIATKESVTSRSLSTAVCGITEPVRD